MFQVVSASDSKYNKNSFEVKYAKTAPFISIGDFDAAATNALQLFADQYLHVHDKDDKKRVVVNDKEYDSEKYAERFQKWYVWHPMLDKPLQTIEEFVSAFTLPDGSVMTDIRVEEG